jgi:hypothetical protein
MDLLPASLQEIQTLRDLYFKYLVFSTIVVFMGVVFEEADEFASYLLSKVRIRQRVPVKWLVPRHRRLAWMKALSRLGWMMLVIGVLGEGAFEDVGSPKGRPIASG